MNYKSLVYMFTVLSVSLTNMNSAVGRNLIARGSLPIDFSANTLPYADK